MATIGKTIKVSGPLIVAENMADAKLYDVVRVSEKGLIGEIIELRGDKASIQVYEETAGLGVGENVYSTGEPLSAELAPGLITAPADRFVFQVRRQNFARRFGKQTFPREKVDVCSVRFRRRRSFDGRRDRYRAGNGNRQP